MSGQMRPIYFNGKFYAGGLNGVHRVADRLIRELDEILGEMPSAERPEVTLLAPQNRKWGPVLHNIKLVEEPRGQSQLWEQFVLPRRARGGLLVNLCNLAPVLQEAHGLQTAKVTGKGGPKSTLKKGYDFQELLTLFSPRSKEKAVMLPGEPAEVDLLIGTDCISEGQNLQDCDYLINYDIHWNPVRIIQRFGRVDRIGSPNNSIQLVNYWPDISLDEYINLKDRVESRMMIADVSATGDDNVLSAC